MDYDQLASFLEVSKLQSFSRAAEKLFRTQPAISAQVRLLEQECGEKLFDRSGKKVQLTPAGEILLRYAEKMLSLHKEALQTIAELNQTPRGKLYMGANVFGKILGIIGLGQVGRAVARRAAGFGMAVLGWQPHRLTPEEEAAAGVTWVERGELLARSDFICLCSPLTRETYHQIGAAELACLKPGAILVNTARGSEVDEAAVAQALAEGRLGGYAADVFELEDPLPAGLPDRLGPAAAAAPAAFIPAALLQQADRTVFTPHSSTAVPETRALIARAQAQAVLDVFQGRRPVSAANDPAGGHL